MAAFDLYESPEIFARDMDATFISKPTTGRAALVACHWQVRGTSGVMDGTVSGRLIG
jgi:hypothetical protein